MYNKIEPSWLKCSECGGKFPVIRQRGRKRGIGHIKDLWCPYCKKETKFVERTEEML